ncbi:unnamed protein product [Phytophthora fragariaefolia]|uniref:Unnamed protein product n=1 Tax=Phytophthora fragariaefolia TaxID=1490495 RepID=A0A9W6XPI1_9STRA|nr:unnamed protein product [Phytophthora fragariaefolia]
MCAEQVILKEGFPGFGENPYIPAKPQQQHGDPFWEKLIRYKQSGTLMGCSIQPPVTAKDVAVESSAGNGLYFKHAYALVDVAEIKTAKGDSVRLVKLRNPWGTGEWVRYTIALGKADADSISQEEVTEINTYDGTFFMSYDAWMQSFTHFFAGIDFPDAWCGRRSEGSWNEANCGGNTTKSTWINNPHFELVLDQRARIFASLSQEDPRGSDNIMIVPVGFHICSLTPSGNDSNKFEIREPPNKLGAYYRLYKPAERESFQSGKRPERLPPAIIPGSVIPGIDDDGVPQPAYTFKQAVSDKATGKTNVGNFWLSVYSDKPSFCLEGGEEIVEEEEGDSEFQSAGERSRGIANGAPGHLDRRLSTASSSKKSDRITATGNALAAERRRKYENEKEELLRQAKRFGVGLRELRVEFGKTPRVQKAECRHKLQKLGFNVASWDDEKIGLLFGEEDGLATGVIHTEKILKLFTPDIQEEKMACELPDMEEDGDNSDIFHREGILEIEVHGASGLSVCEGHRALVQRKVQILAPEFSASQNALRRRIAIDIFDRDPSMRWHLRYFARKSPLLTKTRYGLPDKNCDEPSRSPSPSLSSAPVAAFYALLEKEYTTRFLSSTNTQDEVEFDAYISRTPTYSRREGVSFHPVLSPKDAPSVILNLPSSNAVELHKCSRIRDLEVKRSDRLTALLQHKQQALGNAEKVSVLPRLIGGRKSGSSHVNCIDCGEKVFIQGRGDRQAAGPNESMSFPCNGARCMNVFCLTCYSLLPLKSKLCEECFQHEISSHETLGEQLRVVLIEKIGASDHQREKLDEVFRFVDVDGSGSLSLEEFDKMLDLLRIEPALTQGQKTFLVDQFDTNGDGEVSLTEFQAWILRDRVWEEPPPFLNTARENLGSITPEIFDAVITPICNEIMDIAFDAYMFSLTIGPWSRSTNSTSDFQNAPEHSDVAETGDIIFQRVVNLSTAFGVATNAVEKVFEQVDGDGSGNIDQFEFIELLSALGIHLNFQDVTLLMNRLGAKPTGARLTIERSAFIAYAERITSKNTSRERKGSLKDILLRFDTISENVPNMREMIQCQLQQLHENMSHKELIAICKALDEKAAIDIAVDDLRSIAINLSYDFETSPSTQHVTDSTGQVHSVKSSGDMLARMILQESTGFVNHLKAFDGALVCGALSTHLQIRSGTISTKIIWRSVFGVDTSDVIHLRDFNAAIMRTGFLISAQNGPTKGGDYPSDYLLTQITLSLAVDAVRIDWQEVTQRSSAPVIDFNLFRLIMRIQKIQEIELRFNHALANFLQLCHGEQQHLVTMALETEKRLVIRARDPVFRFCADFVLNEDEYDYHNLLTQFGYNGLERRAAENHGITRELAFAKSPHGIVTSEYYPELNNAMLAILERIRVDYRRHNHATSHSSRPYVLNLSLVESDSFIATLRNLLSRVELPFFWMVSPRSLVLSIDSEYLDQQDKTSFQQLVADSLSPSVSQLALSLRALVTFVSHTVSSLLVRYEVVGRHNNVETSWREFQAFIAGHQNTYAVLELHPQGSLFSTRVARASGSGAVQWTFKTQIKLEEPKLCDHRIDRPVVFTDTVKVSRIPGSTPTTESINFIVTDSTESPGHLVVISVRRAIPSGLESPKPRLYCTAYDPLTSCDYAVEGYPVDWSVDFFDVAVNPSFEDKWHVMLGTMRLGAAITPKLFITVFNKKAKTDKLIGECEVSVGSAIVQEGHIFEERVALHPPLSSPSESLATTTTTNVTAAGVAALTFRFDVKKTPINDVITKSNLPQGTGIPVPIEFGAQYLAGEITSPRLEPVEDNNCDELKQLQSAMASIQQSKREAQEQVRQLQAQLQQLSYASNRTSDDTAERWKRRLEQARQEQFSAEEQYAARCVFHVSMVPLCDLTIL